ncbi:MAG TPA: adenosylcobinamide-GDP ribazoletransferase [Stellaceae bacterium]
MQEEPPRWGDAAGWWDELRLVLGFLTRVPVFRAEEVPAGALARASWSFPIVGLGIGLVGGIAYGVVTALGVPLLPAALIAVGATVLVTGALHEDGLADTADGFFGGADREARLAIMRDSRSGAYGVLALVFSITLRAAALAAIGDAGHVAAALVAAHTAARGGLPLIMRALEPARLDGLGAAAGRPEAPIAWGAAGLGALIALVTLGFVPGIAALVIGAAAMMLMAGLARRQIGGYTGDALGAVEQAGEIVILLAAAAWAR